MFLDLLSHECALYKYLMSRCTQAVRALRLRIINQQLATTLFGCGHCMQQSENVCNQRDGPLKHFFMYIHDKL